MECSLFSEFKIDKICFYAEIITEKREIRWHLARIRENFENQNFDFIKIEILYPEKRSEQVSREISHLEAYITSCISHYFIQIEIFKGLLFETEINISKCVLANVEELTQPISECSRMMKNFLTDGNRGFIRLNGTTANDNEMHVQLYKTVRNQNSRHLLH